MSHYHHIAYARLAFALSRTTCNYDHLTCIPEVPSSPSISDEVIRSQAALQGEQTQAVSSKSKEADGITAVPDPPAPEEEEPPPAEAEAEGEEGDEPKPEAAAEEKMPVTAKNLDDFPQKDGVIVELSALPGVRQICSTITSS